MIKSRWFPFNKNINLSQYLNILWSFTINFICKLTPQKRVDWIEIRAICWPSKGFNIMWCRAIFCQISRIYWRTETSSRTINLIWWKIQYLRPVRCSFAEKTFFSKIAHQISPSLYFDKLQFTWIYSRPPMFVLSVKNSRCGEGRFICINSANKCSW